MNNACFSKSVVAAIQLKETERESSYPHYTTVLNLKDIELKRLMTLNQIKKIENQNNISINVYCIEKKKVILSIRLTDRKLDKHVNLLYVQDVTVFCRASEKSLQRWYKIIGGSLE